MCASLCSPLPGWAMRRQALRLALVGASISLFMCRSGYALYPKLQYMDTRADVSTSYRLGCTPQNSYKRDTWRAKCGRELMLPPCNCTSLSLLCNAISSAGRLAWPWLWQSFSSLSHYISIALP